MWVTSVSFQGWWAAGCSQDVWVETGEDAGGLEWTDVSVLPICYEMFALNPCFTYKSKLLLLYLGEFQYVCHCLASSQCFIKIGEGVPAFLGSSLGLVQGEKVVNQHFKWLCKHNCSSYCIYLLAQTFTVSGFTVLTSLSDKATMWASISYWQSSETQTAVLKVIYSDPTKWV